MILVGNNKKVSLGLPLLPDGEFPAVWTVPRKERRCGCFIVRDPASASPTRGPGIAQGVAAAVDDEFRAFTPRQYRGIKDSLPSDKCSM